MNSFTVRAVLLNARKLILNIIYRTISHRTVTTRRITVTFHLTRGRRSYNYESKTLLLKFSKRLQPGKPPI